MHLLVQSVVKVVMWVSLGLDCLAVNFIAVIERKTICILCGANVVNTAQKIVVYVCYLKKFIVELYHSDC